MTAILSLTRWDGLIFEYNVENESLGIIEGVVHSSIYIDVDGMQSTRLISGSNLVTNNIFFRNVATFPKVGNFILVWAHYINVDCSVSVIVF